MVALNGCYRELANIIERVQVFKKFILAPTPIIRYFRVTHYGIFIDFLKYSNELVTIFICCSIIIREDSLFIKGGIGITTDPVRNSYDPPLIMTFLKLIEIPMTPLNRISI